VPLLYTEDPFGPGLAVCGPMIIRTTSSYSTLLLALGCSTWVACTGAPADAASGGNTTPAGNTGTPTDISGITASAAIAAAATYADDPTMTDHSTHRRCGWIGADTAAEGTATFVAFPDFYDAIHPKWFTLKSDGSPRAIAFTDDKTVTDTARAHHVQLIPLIDADSGGYLRTVFATPASIAKHVSQLVDLVMQHGYDGLELDYEHLWTKNDRGGYTALIKAAAEAMHAHGKVLTLAVPAMDHDDGNNAYDYHVLNPMVDVLHMMAYDFHGISSDHMGPIAPLAWVDAVAARAASIGDPAKYVLAVANYGISNGWYGSIVAAIQKCGGKYDTTTDHMSHCSYGTQAPGRAPHCGNVWFEDPGSVAEKVASAAAHNLGGFGYWTVGAEPMGFFEAIHAKY
jgi:chitinase